MLRATDGFSATASTFILSHILLMRVWDSRGCGREESRKRAYSWRSCRHLQ